jgi:hypothetical protein
MGCSSSKSSKVEQGAIVVKPEIKNEIVKTQHLDNQHPEAKNRSERPSDSQVKTENQGLSEAPSENIDIGKKESGSNKNTDFVQKKNLEKETVSNTESDFNPPDEIN